MRNDLRVPIEKLRMVVNPNGLGFEDTSAVAPAQGFIGHERAVRSIEMGLEINSPEYNIFVAGDTGISRKSVLLEFLTAFAEKKAAAGGFSLRDFCCVHNFEKPDEPVVLIFNRGEGRKFRTSLEVALHRLQKGIPEVLKSDEHSRAEDDITKATKEKIDKLTKHLEEEMKKSGFRLLPTPTGPMVASLSRRGGPPQPMSQEEYDTLDEETRRETDEGQAKWMKNVDNAFRQMYGWRKEAQRKIEAMERGLIGDFLKNALGLYTRRYSDYPEAVSFLRGLQDYVLKNINFFRENGAAEPNGHIGHAGHAESDPFMPFRVNLFVDNSQTKQIPVVFESNPTFHNLFGRMEKKFVQGGYLTDHTYLKAGSLLSADGGYLVLNIRDVVMNVGVWEKLEKTIRYGFLKIEEPMSYLGFVPNNLNPKPIPVRLKVILVGTPELYQLLVQHDPEFLAIFKIKAELESEMPSTPSSRADYAAFIARCVKEDDSRRESGGLLHLASSAAAKILEHGHRLAGDQRKLSLAFNEIKDLIEESNYWAEKAGSDKVKAEHVQRALESQRLRAGLAESKLQEFIKDEILLITTDGSEVGQINCLVVLGLGDYSFGLPSRITAATFLGKKGVVSIDREVKMTGPVHDKGVHILSGYFGKKYGKENVISFSASICFEQSYHEVEGDSASVAELICLISSLTELPINQCFAVTGSVNQKGEIQPIGGVNEKIEGFFDVCKERGLTGDHGVVIPHQNVRNLMLREDVVDACRQGKFYVYAVKTTDEVLEILLNESAETIHQKVEERLSKMAAKIKRAGGRFEE